VKREALLDQAVRELEAKLEQSREAEGSAGFGLPEQLQEQQALQATVQAALAELDAADESHLHPHDRDARVMKCRDKGRTTFSYNDQAVVDEQSKLIVAEEATSAVNDNGHLTPMLAQTEATLGAAAATTVADGGYASAEQFALAEGQGHAVMVNLSERLKENPAKPLAGSNFRYDAATDTVICPLGERLLYTHTRWHSGKQQYLRCYHCRNRDCPLRAECSKDRGGRRIELGPHHEALQRQREKHRDADERAKLSKRGYTVEPVFGWIKQQLGFRRHGVFGLEGVQAEWSLIAAVYNLHRLYRCWRAGGLPGLGAMPGGSGPEPWAFACA